MWGFNNYLSSLSADLGLVQTCQRSRVFICTASCWWKEKYSLLITKFAINYIHKYIKLVKKCKICQYLNNNYNKNIMGMSDLGFRSDQAIYYHKVSEKTTKFLWRITLLLITHPGFGGRVTLMSYDKPDLHIQSSIYILTIKER